MIDIKLIRADPDKFTHAARVKNVQADIPALIEADRRLVDARKELQAVRTGQNAAGKKIAKLNGDEKLHAISELAHLKNRAKELNELVDHLQPKFDELMLLAAQPPAPDVPVGADESDNVPIRTVGKIPTFDFQPKDHVQLGKDLDIIDIPRGVKLAGSRNYTLKGAGAILHQAVLKLAVNLMTEKGYTLLTVPVLVNEAAMYGTGFFPVGRDDAYLCERDKMSLIGTAEVPLTAYHAGEILDQADLAKKYVALSTCFRREAGAAGKDTKGLYRIHYFDKVEQVILCRNDEQTSIDHHRSMLADAEEMMKALELPYRVVNVCTGDLGQGQVQKFDVEAWMPSRDAYGETHSASRYHEFQARRLNIRYRDDAGKLQFVHTLNNTVIASPRILIPLLEIHQTADGGVSIPTALRPYMNGRESISTPGS